MTDRAPGAPVAVGTAGSDAADPLLGLRLAAVDGAEPLLALVPGTDGDPTVAWCNAAAAELLGVGSDELVGRRLGRPAAADSSRPDWAAAAAALVAHPGDWRGAQARRLDGTDVDLRLLVRPVPPHGWVVHLRQIVDADEAVDTAIAHARDRLLVLAEHAPLGIVMSDGGARLGFVNDRLVELVGVPRDQLLGTRWLDLVDPVDLAALHEALHAVLSGSPVDAEVRMLSPVSAPRLLHWRLAPVTTSGRAAGFVGTVEDVTVRRAWESRLTHQATHDALTGLANRRYLVETITELLASRRHPDRAFGVLFCDLDGFKEVNDTLGHEAGDRVLIEVARRLRANARDSDLVARIAGDEFVIVLRGLTDDEDAEAAVERQLAAVEHPVHVAGRQVRITASIGLALPGEHDTPESLLRAADRRMYDVKRARAGGAPAAGRRGAGRHGLPGNEPLGRTGTPAP